MGTERLYIYHAELLCERCGEAIWDKRTRKGKAPANPDNESTYDSDNYPKCELKDNVGNSDTPQHCGACGVYLRIPLTPAGQRYALEALERYTTDRTGNVKALDEWAADLREYALDGWGKLVLTAYSAARAKDRERNRKKNL